MSTKAKQFIYNYENNRAEYDNNYLIFKPGFMYNTIWFRYNTNLKSWEWSNDLIYWKVDYNNRKCSVWMDKVLDNHGDINYILNYLKIKDLYQNINKMNDVIDKIAINIDEIYHMDIEDLDNPQLNILQMYEKINCINSELKTIYSNQLVKKKYYKPNLKKQNNIKGNNMTNFINYLQGETNNIDTTDIIYEPFLEYQSRLLQKLDANPTKSITDNDTLINDKIIIMRENIDNQVFENSLLQKKINSNRSMLISNKNEINTLKIKSIHIVDQYNQIKSDNTELILSLERMKETNEGMTFKVKSLSSELINKESTIRCLKLENESLISQMSELTQHIEYDKLDDSILKNDFDIINYDDLD